LGHPERTAKDLLSPEPATASQDKEKADPSASLSLSAGMTQCFWFSDQSLP
jgi:hypothetical protein